jgi:hypothetical protein
METGWRSGRHGQEVPDPSFPAGLRPCWSGLRGPARRSAVRRMSWRGGADCRAEAPARRLTGNQTSADLRTSGVFVDLRNGPTAASSSCFRPPRPTCLRFRTSRRRRLSSRRSFPMLSLSCRSIPSGRSGACPWRYRGPSRPPSPSSPRLPWSRPSPPSNRRSPYRARRPCRTRTSRRRRSAFERRPVFRCTRLRSRQGRRRPRSSSSSSSSTPFHDGHKIATSTSQPGSRASVSCVGQTSERPEIRPPVSGACLPGPSLAPRLLDAGSASRRLSPGSTLAVSGLCSSPVPDRCRIEGSAGYGAGHRSRGGRSPAGRPIG